MKKLSLSLLLSLTIAACSSGTTVSDSPENQGNTSGRFQGTFQNIDNSQSGTVILDITTDSEDTDVTGNIIFQSSGQNCLENAPVEGTVNGFTVSLTAAQSRTTEEEVTTTTEPVTTTDPDGTSTTTPGTSTTNVETTVLSGTINMQLSRSDSGNTLSGTYVTTGNTCSNQTGSGSMTLSR